MEDYKQKYEQALERAKICYKDLSNLDGVVATMSKDFFEEVFPELKESEDERIRKECISIIDAWDKLCRSQGDYCEVAPKCIAWLEKQGEQKPADKVEPKFKVGDWITDGTSTFNIVKIEDEWYIADDGDKVCFDVIHQYYHLWTIQDAKDGDVLASHECLVLFKEIDGLNIKCHCTYYFTNIPMFFVNTFGTVQNKDAFNPSTKEQRDLLLHKMEEAGYEWDSEKKELKKIEHVPADKVEPKFKVGDTIRPKGSMAEYTIESIYGECYHGKGWGLHFSGEDDYELVEPKPSWSEEDKLKMDTLIHVITNQKGSAIFEGLLPEELVNWLKSIKERYTWKPSDEQMEALWNVIPHIPNSEKDIDTITELSVLYEDLKKLKEK